MKLFNREKGNRVQKIIKDLMDKNDKLQSDLLDSELTIELKVKRLDDLIKEVEASDQLFKESLKELDEAKAEYIKSAREFNKMQVEYEKEMENIMKGV